jgi:NADH:ubiquinone oxidoreductase subunit F (NADH-binding)
MPLDPAALRTKGAAFGCGVVGFLGDRTCGVAATARIMDYMAGSSAAQCGPCVYGLRAIADATARLATFTGVPDDLRRLRGWTESIPGRGACRLPDGTVGLLRSALAVFESDWSSHQFQRHCAHR